MKLLHLLLPAGLAAALALSSAAPARADGDVAAGIAGLALFGLLLGEALDDDDHHRGYAYTNRNHDRRFDNRGSRGNRFDNRGFRGNRFGNSRGSGRQFGNGRGAGRNFGNGRNSGRFQGR